MSTELEAEARELRYRIIENGFAVATDAVAVISEALAAAEARGYERGVAAAARVALHEWESPQEGYDEAFANVLAAISALRAAPAGKGEKL